MKPNYTEEDFNVLIDLFEWYPTRIRGETETYVEEKYERFAAKVITTSDLKEILWLEDKPFPFFSKFEESIKKFIYEEPLENMPLFIDKAPFKKFAEWRLRILK